MVDIDNIQDLLCNIKDAMKDVFMPRTELTETYSPLGHTHPVDNSLSGTSTNPVQNKVIKNKTDSIETALNGKSNTNHTHPNASENSPGFLSPASFQKLSNIATGATKNDPYTSNPLMDGTASPGGDNNYARGDHRHPTDTSRAPTNHATTATTYGVSSTSNYGHSMATSTTPKALATSASLGSETAKFARGDHVHPLPANANSSTNGLMSSTDKNKLDSVDIGATVNNRNVKLELFSPADNNNGPIIDIVRHTGLRFDIFTEFEEAVPYSYKVYYSLNGSVYHRAHGERHIIDLPAGSYQMNMIFKGGGPYNQAYRSIILRVSE